MIKTDRDVAFLLGLPFHVITMEETVGDAVAQVEARKPGYYVTANADFIAQAYSNEGLKDILFHADRVVCDGMPLVWLSRYFKPVLPERVAGSDMVFRLFREADGRNWKVYFLGSDTETLAQTKSILAKDYPGMEVVGAFSPPFCSVDAWPNEEIIKDVHATRPDLLLVAVGCPKQEYWISRFYEQAGVPLSIGIGASLDFICGTQTRAPVWVQKVGMEWCWRMAMNPKRLVKRYAKDFYYLAVLANRQRQLTAQKPVVSDQKSPRLEEEAISQAPTCYVPQAGEHECNFLSWGGEVERGNLDTIPLPPGYDRPLFLDLSGVSFIDSSGIGLLAKVARESHAAGVIFGLVHPSEVVEKVIQAMHLDAQLPSYHDEREAMDFVMAQLGPAHVLKEKVIKLLSPFGRKDHLECQEVLNQAVEELLEGEILMLDLSDLEMLDSFAISQLLNAYRSLHSRGLRLRVIRPKEQALQTMRMTGVYDLLVEGRVNA
ncbi:MAG: WecB/TagA/CpsF family glycosyltransferase [Verrucomicrobiota bacterium]